MISVRPLASCVSVCGKNFNIVIFLDTMNMINFELCMVVVFVEFYRLKPFLVTLTLV